MKHGITALIALFVLMAMPETLGAAIMAQRTEKGTFDKIKGGVTKLCGDNAAVSGAILGGIMIMIIGFATLVIGNYIVYAIITSLPALANSNYNSTLATVENYATTVIPLFGLALMVLGFAIILFTLRSSMQTDGR